MKAIKYRLYCIYHSPDLDGLMSAAIVKLFYKLNNSDDQECKYLKIIPHNYGQRLPNIQTNVPIIMSDVSVSVDEMARLSQISNQQFTYIDHHFSAIKDFLESDKEESKHVKTHFSLDNSKSACELTYEFLIGKDIPEIVESLGKFDTFRVTDKAEQLYVLYVQLFCQTYYFGVNKCLELLDLEFGSLSDEQVAQGKAIYDYVKKEFNQLYRKASSIELDGVKFLAVNREYFNPIMYDIDYQSDGYDVILSYFYSVDKWKFSVYCDNGKIDCSEFCKQFGGGGHQKAAGFILSKEEFKTLNFIK